MDVPTILGVLAYVGAALVLIVAGATFVLAPRRVLAWALEQRYWWFDLRLSSFAYDRVPTQIYLIIIRVVGLMAFFMGAVLALLMLTTLPAFRT